MATRRRGGPAAASFINATSPASGQIQLPGSDNESALIYGYGDLPTTVVSHPSTGQSTRNGTEPNGNQGKQEKGGKSKVFRSKPTSQQHHDGGEPHLSCGRFRAMMILFIVNLTVILMFQFYRQPQRNLSKLAAIHHFLEPAKPMLGVDYVVFVTASTTHAGGTYVRMGRSNVTALAALQDASRKLPVSKLFYWFQIDYIDGMQRLTNFNYDKPLADRYGDWFGLGLNWDAEIAYLPSQVNAYCFVDKSHYLRWERMALWMHRHNMKGLADMVPDFNDDATFLEQLDLFHTKSIFIDLSDSHHHSVTPAIELDHGHRYYLETKLTAHDLRQAAIVAGKYLMQTSTNSSTSLVSYYLPRSHFVEYSHGSPDLWYGHASALFAMSKLHTFWRDSRLLHSITTGVEYLKTHHLKHCPLPNGNIHLEGLCLRDDNERSSYLVNNAMFLLAMAEFYETTASNDSEIVDTITKLANFVEGSFVDTYRLFLNKIVFDQGGSVKLDTETEDESVHAHVAFSLARVANLLQAKRQRFRKEWKELAYNTIDQLVSAQIAKFSDTSSDLIPDSWLLLGISEIYKFHRHSRSMMDYTAAAVDFTTRYQIQQPPKDKSERIDLWGSFMHDSSATTSAALSHGLCSVFPMVDNKRALHVSLELSAKFQLQYQIKPETAMWMRDPQRILGGMREGPESSDMSILDSSENILSFLCISMLLQ